MSNVNFTETERSLTDNDFTLVEQKLGVKLPHDFVAFYKLNNGGTPDKPVTHDFYEKMEDIEIRDFIPILYAEEFQDDPDFTLEGRAKEHWHKKEVPENLLPFAFDWGGNYICLGLPDGLIYYYVRDVWSENLSTEQNFLRNSTPIAPSFRHFIEHLSELVEE
ncbi:MAG: SMI1/KNR4 family protein [Proteobacteria bacterium]|nr:SMI1/KNR4 family protein [Pseudomonadota bacterium]